MILIKITKQRKEGTIVNLILLDEMIQYIEEHLNETLNYQKLSRIVGLPPYILERVFEFLTNMSLMGYIRKRRLSKAYEELQTSHSSITEIALNYSYSSNSSFCRAFKKHFNLLPKEVKKNDISHAFPKIAFAQNIIDNEAFSIKSKTWMNLPYMVKNVK